MGPHWTVEEEIRLTKQVFEYSDEINLIMKFTNAETNWKNVADKMTGRKAEAVKQRMYQLVRDFYSGKLQGL